jgi:hypothetical protein
MSFTCTLPTFDPEIDGERLTFGIGYDESASYTVVLGFSPLEKDGHAEFYFVIYRFNNVSEVTQPLYSGLITRKFIENAADRQLIMDAVCVAIPVLLEYVRPEWVFRCTHDADLEGRALLKHEAIAGAFKSCGYEEHAVSDRAGCKAWWMWNAPDNGSLDVIE